MPIKSPSYFLEVLKLEEWKEKNRDIYVNFGLIAYGKLRSVEELQKLISEHCEELKIVYQCVSGSRLFLLKKKPVTGKSEKWEKKK